jgi:subtilisin family serine protease
LVAALNKAVNYAGANGVLVVSAAGNDALDLDHSANVTTVPAMSGSGLAVSATGPEGYAVGYPNGATNFRAFASYSNWGNSLVSIAGPGGDFRLPGSAVCSIPAVPAGSVSVPCWVFDMVISPCRGSGTSNTSYCFAAGTSMAAPAASGVAALIKQSHPGISMDALKAKLMQSADDEGKKGNDPFYGKGFINAANAVQ